MQKDKEDLEEISSELELADEDEKVPYVCLACLIWKLLMTEFCSRYKIGDSFYSLPLPEVQERLSASVDKINDEVTALEEKLSELREEMSDLKAELYGRFGSGINLEA